MERTVSCGMSQREFMKSSDEMTRRESSKRTIIEGVNTVYVNVCDVYNAANDSEVFTAEEMMYTDQGRYVQ